MSLAQKAGQAGALMLIRKGWGALISFGVMAYLARVLNKEDFGLVAISATLIGLIQVVAVSGISEYLIFYKGEDEEDVISAGFWLNLTASIIVVIIVLVVTPFWSTFYSDERITQIVYLLLLCFFANSLSDIPVALFRKRLDYKPLVFIQTVFGTFSNLSQIGFAFFGFGVYSLIIPQVITLPLMTLVLFWRSGFIPRWDAGIKHWRKIIHFTKYVIGQRVLGKLVNEGDTLMVGKFFTLEVLGVYNLAFQFANLFIAHFLPIITNVTLPVFAKNNNNIPLVINHYHKVLRIISFITVPTITLMILNGEVLITTIYGVKWIDAVLPFQILSLFVLVRSVGSPTSGLYSALGKPQIGLYFTMIFAPIFLVVIFLSSFWNDLILIVITISAIRMVGSFTHFILVARILKNSLMSVLKIMFPIFCSALIAFCIVLLIPNDFGIYWIVRSSGFLLIMWILMRFYWVKDFHLFMKDLYTMVPLKFQRWFPYKLISNKSDLK